MKEEKKKKRNKLTLVRPHAPISGEPGHQS